MRVLDNIQYYDLRLLLWCSKSHYYPKFLGSVRAISLSGDGYMQLLLPLTLIVISPSAGLEFTRVVLLAFALERPLYWVLKNGLKRQRPPEAIPEFKSIIQASDQFSFPSGHTMAAFLLAGIATATLGSAALPMYLWASAVGASRVILGVHYPTDIVAGATIGSLIALLVTVSL